LSVFSVGFLNGLYSNLVKPNNVYFVVGQSFYNTFNSFFIHDFCRTFFFGFFKNSGCLNLFSNVGIINSLVYGFNNVKQNTKTVSSFIFLESMDDSVLLNKMDFASKENFVVYKGCFFDNAAKLSNLVFPSLSFFEQRNLYYNCYGQLKSTKKVVHNEYIVIDNFYQYLLNFYRFYFINNFSYLNSIFSLLRFFDFLSVEFKFFEFKNANFLIDPLYGFPYNKSFYQNVVLCSNVFNFYKSDAYSRNSKNLHLASLEYLRLISVYN